MNKRITSYSKILNFLLMLIVLQPLVGFSQTVDECLACHEDKSITTEKNGKAVSLFVDRAAQNKSPHAKLICTACHIGFDAQNIPHKEKIEPVNCLTCHNDAPLKHPFHVSMLNVIVRDASLSAKCKQCHGTHNVTAIKRAGSKYFSAS
jgi:hypothetical protein